jgi:hypothetical protein
VKFSCRPAGVMKSRNVVVPGTDEEMTRTQ